jgi:Transposase IS116/IS110/IS902 family
MTIVETSCPIVGGGDTHLDVHVAAAVDRNGALLGCSHSRRRRMAVTSCRGGLAPSGCSIGSGWKLPAPMAQAWHATLPRRVWRWSRLIARTAKNGDATASRTSSTRSKPHGRRCRVVRVVTRRVAQVPSEGLRALLVAKRSARSIRIRTIGVDTAAILLVAAGDNTARIRTEAAWAHLCGVTPIPAGSGTTNTRRRLNSGGNRQANHALWRIVLTRLGHGEPRTVAYMRRRLAEGRTKPEIIRSLKRYVAREIFQGLNAPSSVECANATRPGLEAGARPNHSGVGSLLWNVLGSSPKKAPPKVLRTR